MFGGTLSPLHRPPAPPTVPTAAPKRPFDQLDESQHVGPNGPNGLSQRRLPQQQHTAADSPAAGEPRSRPVFKMKRTGHSGPFPFSGRPVLRSDSADAQPGPAAAPPSFSPGAAEQTHSSPFEELVAGLAVVTPMQKKMFTRDSDSRSSSSVTTNPIRTATAQPAEKNMESRRSLTESAANGHGELSLFESASPRSFQSTSTRGFPKVRLPPEVQKVFDAALDDRPYKTWKDKNGKLHPTSGALLPAGYQQSDNPVFPWLCPVRSCRKLLSSLFGLGKHFCNSHRAARFNDNLDGTLTDLGTYANPGHGNGRKHGGYAKPPLIVSKRAMSMAEAPMADVSLHHNALKGTVPQRGGPRRSTITAKEASIDVDSTSSEDETVVSTKPKQPQQRPPLPPAGASKSFDMANPDRPYNKWPAVVSDPGSPNVDSDRDRPDANSDAAISLATDGRPYREWWDESGGELVNMAGALIPEAYELDDTFPTRPWVCPIRSCRLAFKVRQHLGYHFMTTHRSCALNDNCDGTFSIVSRHFENAPRVVSQKPLDPNEPPLPEPRLPPNSLDARTAERQGGKLRVKPLTPASNTASTAPAASNRPAASPVAANHLWSHITSHIDGEIPMPEIPELKLLLSLTKVRDLAPIQPISADLTDKQIAGLIIQVTGVEAANPCTECRRHNGPFASCVHPSRKVAQDIAGFMRSSLRACANCFLRKNSSRCSVKSLSANGTTNNLMAPELLREDLDNMLSDDAKGMSMPSRRRSARLTLANSELNGDDDAEDEEESADEAPVPDPEDEPLRRTRRLITLKVPKPAQQHSRGAGGGRPAIWNGDPPPAEADLRMGEWEMDEGRVHAAGEPLAFSSTYLTANQSVQVSQNINFQAITIMSGRVHQFPAEQAKTRMCTLASGKLRVQVGDDEFVVGQGGIFKVLPDVACTVTNRCYVDVVLHVTSLDRA